MNILIIGGTRFVGNALVRKLVNTNHRVAVLSRRATDVSDRVTGFAGERDEVIEDISRRFSADLLLDFIAYRREQVEQALHLFPAAAYMFVSSIWVSRMNSQQRADQAADRQEMDDPRLLDETKQYVRNKAGCERAVIQARQEGRRALIVRLPIVMGEQDHTQRLDFYLQRIGDGNGVLLVNDGKNAVTAVYKQDAANALAKLVDIDFLKLNVIIEGAPPGQSLTVRELLSHLSGSAHGVAVSDEVLQAALPEYLKQEPLWLEKSHPPTENNLFTITHSKPTPPAIWLASLAHAATPDLPSELRSREIQFMAFHSFERDMRAIGDQIRAWRGDRQARQICDPQQFKTRADKAAHNLIMASLQKHFDYPVILSEEADSFHVERPERYWIIDPIDGTASWYDGFDGYVTQAALIDQGVPVYGLVYAPQSQRFWTAHRGKGALINGHPLAKITPGVELKLVDNYPEPKRIAKQIVELLEIKHYVESGSMGLKACLVAEGVADIFVKDVLFRDWDIAPAQVILTEMGAEVCDLSGQEVLYNEQHEKHDGLLVTANRQIKDKVLSCLHK